MEEEFRPIKDFPIYAISNFGNIANLRTGKIKKPHDNGRGYYDVLFYKNKIRHTFRVHRLVAEIFIDNIVMIIINIDFLNNVIDIDVIIIINY